MGELTGQGWPQIGELGLAFVLSAIIGLEREVRHKSAGLRTHTLVGFAAALIMLVSKYGFGDILAEGRIVLDPSRIAAQIVTGIGFIGGGLIFVRRDSVRGLTTAAIVWLTTAVGMACGAGLPILALVVTAFHFIVVFAFPYIVDRLPNSRWTPSALEISYEDGRGILRDVLVACTQYDFAVSRVRVERERWAEDQRDGSHPGESAQVRGAGDLQSPSGSEPGEREAPARQKKIVTVALEIQGTRSVAKLAAKLAEIDGVVSVNAGDANIPSD
ncbi:MgtC/SapB family protein [Methylocapsa sp. S129]|uniref:MgtC/SapB family protein n=1 Tax=Methylocapsa sp. S129 TaxID=1641869 RepID=UPI001AEEDF67|nr:MgtC/SapB family protein [Methylocapsa sp. S129]